MGQRDFNFRVARISSITEIFSPKVSRQLEVFVLRKKKLGISCTLNMEGNVRRGLRFIQRQHFLLTYFTTLSVAPAGIEPWVRTDTRSWKISL